MTVPEPLDAQLLDAATLAQARAIVAAILRVVRAHRQQRTVPVPLQSRLDTLTPQLYLWHWFAWKMGGFKPGVDLATTDDRRVVVIQPSLILYGDPLTEEIVHLPVRSGPMLVSPTSPPELLRAIEPRSKYKFH